MIKGVIFDKDGILFDTQKDFIKGWKQAGNKLGVVVPDTFTNDMAGMNAHQGYELIHRYFPEIDPNEMREEMLKYVKKKQKENLTLMPGVKEILQYLKDNDYLIALASAGIPAMIEDNITRGGIKQYFDAIVSGADVKKAKPEPDIFIMAAHKLGLAPYQCVVFEDSPMGLKAGHAAGCLTIMIPDCYAPTENLRSYCDYIFSDFYKVMDAIRFEHIFS